MAWYTPIYIYVRLLRERRPMLGWLLSLCLNVTFIVQWAIGIYTTYVYIFIFCGCVVVYRAQALVYIYVHLSLLAISLVCLGRAFFRRVARVPDKYKVEEATATALEEATPREGERFHVDKSSEEQTRKQKTLLEEVVREKKLGLIETDTQGRFRYCYVCRQLKPDRAHHCSSCGFCVLKFDHHCPWINKCVGYHNYKFFVLYIFYTLSYITWFVVTTFEGFVRFFLSDNYEENLPWFVHLVASYALLCFFGYYPIADLFVYHADLIANNETTCEIVKRPLIRGDSKADYNLSTYRNVQLVFGWGLWLFPVDTAISDGEHFEARYVERENEARVRLAEEGDEDAE